MLQYGNCCDNAINPKAVYRFLERCEKEKLDINSFMLIKGNTVVAQGCRPPYKPDTNHIMYSMSKSITALALGYAVEEGKISLDDSICKYFGMYDKNGKNKDVTVRHLVTMTAGKMIGMAKNRHGRDWIKIFFDAPFVAKPGKVFMYVNDNFYLLSAIISKVYGQTLVDFLYPRMFEPLEIEKPLWETDMYGNASGGWGLYLKTEDLAKIFVCMSHNGEWDGRQVIPAGWIKQATAYQVPTVKRGHIDNTMGYGFGFWRTSLPDTYRGYGLFGQLGYVFGGKDTVLVATSSISKDEFLADAVNEMYQTLWDKPEAEYEDRLKEKLEQFNSAQMDNLFCEGRSTGLEQKYNCKALKTHSTSFASMLNATITTVMDKALGHIDTFSLSLEKDNCLSLLWKEGTYVNQIRLGMKNEYEKAMVNLGGIVYTAYTKAAWTASNILTVLVRFEETAQVRRLEFDFSNEKHIKVKNHSIPDLPTLAAHYMDFSGMPLPKRIEDLLIKYVAPGVLLIGEPDFYIR
ncbi:serine hydrolase [uncultured Eubacterium sp.]|uniref:serine hydrolase domain-containing protein n=1 Tax=uncultured Eubacterium sp. TaxID=165185 RepID=UPI0015BD125A|nr:serine hydrolase [uncultured Eubacterium sp.]